jgi:hypothetical protein
MRAEIEWLEKSVGFRSMGKARQVIRKLHACKAEA